MPFQPCFDVVKIDNNRFRGSLSGFGFAYCDLVKRDSLQHVAQSVELLLWTVVGERLTTFGRR